MMMAVKKPEAESERIEEDPIVKLENRVYVLEAALAKHLKYHFGNPQ
jgi:hypothetical protein